MLLSLCVTRYVSLRLLYQKELHDRFQFEIQQKLNIPLLSERVKMLLPLHTLKWCCILLNEFKQSVFERRSFVGRDARNTKEEQLAKAKLYFRNSLGH